MGFTSEQFLGGQIRVYSQGILPSHSVLLGAVDVEMLAHGHPQPFLPRHKVLLNTGGMRGGGRREGDAGGGGRGEEGEGGGQK